MRDSKDRSGHRPREVLFVLYYYSPYTSGLTLYVRSLAEGLAQRGYPVTVLCGRHESQSPAVEMINGVRVVRLPVGIRLGKGVILPTLVPRAVKLARQACLVIPVLPLMEAGILSRLTPRNKFLPCYVCDLRLDASIFGRIVEKLAARSARTAVRRARSHIALSEDYAKHSRVIGRFSDRTIGVAPPIDAARFRPREPGPLRDRFGLARHPVVGFAGRLVQEKGVAHLIRAMRDVWAEVPTARLVIVGEGERVAGGGLLDDLRKEAGSDGRVVFTGHLAFDDLLRFYSACSVLVLPSVDPLEAYGMVQVEAMLCGSPVVASDMPGVRIPITVTGMGLLVPPGDEPRLAAAIITVIRDRTRYLISRETVIERLDSEKSHDTMLAIAEDATCADGPHLQVRV